MGAKVYKDLLASFKEIDHGFKLIAGKIAIKR